VINQQVRKKTNKRIPIAAKALLVSGPMLSCSQENPTYYPPSQDAGTVPDELMQTTTIMEGERTEFDETHWPVDERTFASPFGPRLLAAEDFRYDFHRGLDLAAESDTVVKAMADGVVYSVHLEDDPDSLFLTGGNVIVISHVPDTPIPFHGEQYSEYYSVYAHLAEMMVEQGDEVASEEAIGIAGSSGYTDFLHLHFEIRIGTVCSAEFQISNPDIGCSSFFGDNFHDPHVNPFMFLEYDDQNSLSAEIISDSPLAVKVSSGSSELDFNRISATDSGTTLTVDLNQRIGVNKENLDNPYHGGIEIEPMEFNPDSQNYEIIFRFPELTGFESVEVTDVWGNGVSISR
jgi:hypothetical protein